VSNRSHRPIRGLDCRIVSEEDGGLIALPVRAGEMQEEKLESGGGWVLPKNRVAPGEWCNVFA
jgi:hypothetical protein